MTCLPQVLLRCEAQKIVLKAPQVSLALRQHQQKARNAMGHDNQRAKKDKVASNPLQRYCNVDCDCNDFAEQSRNLNLTSTLSGAIFIPKIRKEQAYDY